MEETEIVDMEEETVDDPIVVQEAKPEEEKRSWIDVLAFYHKPIIKITVIIIWLLSLLVISDLRLFIYSTVFFAFVQSKAFRMLLDIITVLAINFEEGVVAMYEMSLSRYNEYDLLDDAGKESSDKYRFQGMDSPVVIANSIHTELEEIVINPICSNLHFVRDYKDMIVRIQRKAVKLLHRCTRLRLDREYDTLENADEIVQDHPVLDLIFGKEKEKQQEKEAEGQGIDNEDLLTIEDIEDFEDDELQEDIEL